MRHIDSIENFEVEGNSFHIHYQVADKPEGLDSLGRVDCRL